jgi:cobalt-zinc-cadmium efflux system membrane fusion protein
MIHQIYNIKTCYLLLVFGLLLITACSQTKKDNTQDTKSETAKPVDGIPLTESQMKAVGITLGTIEEKNLKAIVKANGQLEVPPQNKAEVTLLTGGIVKNITVLEGSVARKGQVLATIENAQLVQLQQDYLTAKSSLGYAKQEYNRQMELKAQNAGTGKIYQQAEANYTAEQAKTASIARQLRQLGIHPENVDEGHISNQIAITAPISGTIGKINIETGSFAEPSKPLMNIVDNSKVHCDLLVYEKDLFKVHKGQSVSFMLTNQDNREITGKIYGINQSFENESKGIILHAIIQNPSKYNLIEGMYVSASIDVGNQMVTAVPTDAIIKVGGKEYIYYLKKIIAPQKAEEKKGDKDGDKDGDKSFGKTYLFDKAEIVSGVSDLGYTEIKLIEELPAKTQIVIKGAFYILSSVSGSKDSD